MTTPNELIASGTLEQYVLGSASSEVIEHVEAMAAAFPEVRKELEEIEIALENLAVAEAVKPGIDVKALMLATIDLTERLQAGEQLQPVPYLHERSAISDYETWLNRPDLQLNGPVKDIQARIIGYAPEVLTAIVWVEAYTPPETHTDQLESFLIVEGTCEIRIGNNVHELGAGDFLTIPLHQEHEVTVTSGIPCKIILQRAAA